MEPIKRSHLLLAGIVSAATGAGLGFSIDGSRPTTTVLVMATAAALLVVALILERCTTRHAADGTD